MPTSDASWTGRLRTIGDLERPDHHLLAPEDICYFIGDYTPRERFDFSTTNQLITNLKKKPSTRGTNQWPHKIKAIATVARAIGASLRPEAIPQLTFVPIPPSKIGTDPEYDDRMLAVARQIPGARDVRDLLFTAVPRDAAHENKEPRDPEVLIEKLGLNIDQLQPAPAHIILLDDMLTTGCSFIACRNLILRHLPGVRVSGIFVSRRVPPKIDFEAILGEL